MASFRFLVLALAFVTSTSEPKLPEIRNMSSATVLELYRLLHRSARLYIPTKAGRSFAQDRIRAEFQQHKYERDPAVINSLLHRAYSALMASIEEGALRRVSGSQ